MLSVVNDDQARGDTRNVLDELAREGARNMLMAALVAESDSYVERFVDELDENGHRLVTHNGTARERTVTTVAGALKVKAPRVNDRRVDEDGKKATFSSGILPPWCRKSPAVVEVLPLLYLRGMSTSDFAPALTEFFGTNKGLSAPVIARLAKSFQDDYQEFCKRDLSKTDYVYVWADGIHFNVRLDEERLCTLVLIGVRLDGRKELIAIQDGYRESEGSWADLLRDAKRRGMRAPILATGDGALGFWKALRNVWPETNEQRCWVHKTANVLSALPKSAHPNAKKMLAEIWGAENEANAKIAIGKFSDEYNAKFPKAVAKITNDEDVLLAFYDFPAEHWVHLRTTNPIESTFATVRLRTKKTKGPGSKAQGLAMAFKLCDAAQQRWHAVNAAHLVKDVRNGATFRDGVLVAELTDQATEEKGAA